MFTNVTLCSHHVKTDMGKGSSYSPEATKGKVSTVVTDS